MRTLKRISVLIIELTVEALLLGGLFGAVIANNAGMNGILGSILAVPVILGLHGYYLIRFLAVVASLASRKWLYPVIAAVVFIGTVAFIAFQGKSDFSAQAQAIIPLFLGGGACLVFACSFAGDRLFRRWNRPVSSPMADTSTI